MRTITTTAGTALELDGDVLAVIETVSRDLLRRQTLEESLFMSFNRYENEQLSAMLRRADRAQEQDQDRE